MGKLKTIRVSDTRRFSFLLKAIKKYTKQKNIERAIVELARYHIPHVVNELYPPKIDFLIVGGDSGGERRNIGGSKASRQISPVGVNPEGKTPRDSTKSKG